MGRILKVNFTEKARQNLCAVLSVANWMSIILALALIGLGIFIKLYVEDFTNLVENYDGNTFPFLLIGVGGVSLIFNVASGFLFIATQDPERRNTTQHFLFAYIIVQFLIAVGFLVSGIYCYIHISHLEGSFHDGFTLAMKRYSMELHVKMEVDLMQSEFACCGNVRYTDWFNADWIADKYKGEYSFKRSKRTRITRSKKLKAKKPKGKKTSVKVAKSKAARITKPKEVKLKVAEKM